MNRHLPLTIALVALAATPAVAAAAPSPTVRSAAASDLATLAPVVNQFRADLGGANNGIGPTATVTTTGRREINWDGVPDAKAVPRELNPDFFAVNSPRGLLLSRSGILDPEVNAAHRFQVSANEGNADNFPVRFGQLGLGYQSAFKTASPQRLFGSTESVTTDLRFRTVPGGTAHPAGLTRGVGVFFTDVDHNLSSQVEVFGVDGKTLGRAFATPLSDGLSFVGLSFPDAIIAGARITAGDSVLGRAFESNTVDAVALDDFIYGEPVAVPTNGESFESGTGPFAPKPGDSQFTTVPDAGAGSFAAFAPSTDKVTDTELTSVSSLPVPETGNPRLTFLQRVDTERGFDGGRLELSVDGGQTFTAPSAAQYLENGPDVLMRGTTGLSGQLAWSGDGGPGFRRTVLDLRPLSGRNVRLRFRYVNDGSFHATGWWVDDVAIAVDAAPAPTTPSMDTPADPVVLPSGFDPGAFESFGVDGPSGDVDATTDRTPPRLTRLTLAGAFRARRAGGGLTTRGGGALALRLSEPARLTLTVHRQSGRPLTRVGTFAVNAPQGKVARRLSGRVAGRRLSPGRYRLTIVARDAAGNAGAPQRRAFRIKR